VKEYSTEVSVGIDVSEAKNAIGIADDAAMPRDWRDCCALRADIGVGAEL
jgi:hypothetical protein